MHRKGFALLSAIILIVLLSGVATFLAKIMASNQRASHMAYLSAQTYQAAHSGLEWGIYHAMQATPLCGYADKLLEIEEGFTVKLSCSSTNYPGEGDIMTILAVASHGTLGKPDHVTRKLEVYVTQPPV